MTNDPTTTPGGEADMPQGSLKSGRGRSRANASYPGMMGDGSEEQNLGQVGDPSARIGETEVQQAFGATAQGAPSASARVLEESRSFIDKTQASAAETLSALTDKVNAMRDQVQQSANAARDWAVNQAGTARDAAKQLQEDKPMLVLSVSAATALAVGLVAGFCIGRATADDY